jgi:hypothetical protein
MSRRFFVSKINSLEKMSKMTFVEYQRTCCCAGQGVTTKYWAMAPRLTVPVHVKELTRTGKEVCTVLSRKELDEAFPANPYSLFAERLGATFNGAKSYMSRIKDERLKRAAAALSDMAKLQPFADKMRCSVRKALFLDDYIEFCQCLCDEWQTLTLDRAPAMQEVYAAGFSASDWFALWRVMLRSAPQIVGLAVPAPKRGAIREFADTWADAAGNDASSSESVQAPSTAIVPQVIRDHSMNDEMLGKRSKHHITANASIEYTLTFEADQPLLEKVVQLLDLDQYDAVDGCQVKGNFVIVLMRGDILDSYPAKGGTNMLELDRLHGIVDAVYNELWELLEHLKEIESKRMLRRMGHDGDGIH